MSPVTPVPLPDAALALLQARCPGARLARAANIAFSLGLVLPLLARTAPFSLAPLGLRVPLTAGELTRGHHLMVLRGSPAALVAYAGWAACTAAQAEGFLGDAGISALDFSRREGEAIAFLTLAALDAGAGAGLEVALRTVLAGTPYVARRTHAAAPQRAVVRRGVLTLPSALRRAAAS
jgi:hypothetical protein